jgi:hypothetical protein
VVVVFIGLTEVFLINSLSLLERQLHFGSSFKMTVALFTTCLETIINYYSKQCTCIFHSPEAKFSRANYRQLLSYNVPVMSQFLRRLTKPALNT